MAWRPGGSYPWGTMTDLTEYILGVSGAVLLAVWVALLIVALTSSRRRDRIPGRPGWLAARCRPGAPTGLALTAAVLTLATSAWSLALVTYGVVHHTGLAHDDPRVLASVIGHRAPWLTSLARVLTWLGSTLVLWPVVVVAGLACGGGAAAGCPRSCRHWRWPVPGPDRC